jgi:hypothetical protein
MRPSRRFLDPKSGICALVGILAGALSPDLVRNVCEMPGLSQS